MAARAAARKRSRRDALASASPRSLGLTCPELEFLSNAVDAGCPRDQVENLLTAGCVLQRRQLDFAAACRECDEPGGPVEVAFGGARGGGKSHGMIVQIGADDCRRFPGLKALFLRRVGSAAKESFEALRPKTIGGLGSYVPSQGMFRFPNGSWIKLGHFKDESDIDKYLGLEYDVIGIEEATLLSSNKHQAIASCNRSPRGSGWRPRRYYSTNPGGVSHAWFKDRFVRPHREDRETSTRYVPATIDDNAYVGEEYRDFLDTLTGWLKAAWRYGDWDISAGQFFTTWSRDHHVRPAPERSAEWRYWLGLDYGWVHPTTAVLFGQSGDGTIWALAEHSKSRWVVERHAAAIVGMLERFGLGLHNIAGVFAGADCFPKRHTGGSVADDYRAHGIMLKPAKVDRILGAANMLRRLGDPSASGGDAKAIDATFFVTPQCPQLAEQIAMVEHDPNQPDDVRKTDCDSNGIGGDDLYDACRYGLMAATQGPAMRMLR